MGRLPFVILAASLSLGCDGDDKSKPTVTRERSQAVAATGATTPAKATTSAPVVAKKPRKKLCEGEMSKPPRAFPDKAMSRSGNLPDAPKVGGGWVWVNFWAAWCVPCKEEMPRLRAWEKRLQATGKSFKLVFVSLDDDPRQLDELLKKEPADGMKATYWLKEGKEREEWLTAAEVDTDPELPAHLLVDPQGKIRCFVQGAVEDGDYTTLATLVN
jgi:thiol-disulfide isomerase/thioredoxin